MHKDGSKRKRLNSRLTNYIAFCSQPIKNHKPMGEIVVSFAQARGNDYQSTTTTTAATATVIIAISTALKLYRINNKRFE